MTREEQEAHWRRKVTEAKQALEVATLTLNGIQEDVNRGLVPIEDGQFGLRNALRAERLARHDYHEALTIFNRLIVDGTIDPTSE